MRVSWQYVGGLFAAAVVAFVAGFLIYGVSLADEGVRRGIEIAILLALVTITAVSVNATVRIASRAADQAQATQALAESAQQQLHSGLKPIVRFRSPVKLTPTADLDAENVGVGPAINLKCWLEVKLPRGGTQLKNSEGNRKFEAALLPVGQSQRNVGLGSWQPRASAEPGDTEHVSYVAVYQDIFGNAFRSEARAQNDSGGLGFATFTTQEITDAEAQRLLRGAGYTHGW